MSKSYPILQLTSCPTCRKPVLQKLPYISVNKQKLTYISVNKQNLSYISVNEQKLSYTSVNELS